MLALVLALQTSPAPPTDAELLAHASAQRPGVEVLSVHSRDLPSDDSPMRTLCGLARLNGQYEPVYIATRWVDPATSNVRMVGQPLPPPRWRTSLVMATHADANEDGVVDRLDRNIDVYSRKLALIMCRDWAAIEAPEGVVWSLETEPDPDRPAVAPGGPRLEPLPRPQG